VPIPSVGALLAAVVLGAAIVIFMDRIIGLRVLAPMSGVRRICSLLSRIRNEECSDGSSDAGDRDSEPQCRLSRVLEEHNLMEALPFLKARLVHDVEDLPGLADEDFAAMSKAGLPKAAYERLKRKKESLLLLSMIQDTDADVGDEELDVVGMLLARGGDVNARDPKSLRSLLSSASARGHVKLVRLLLIRGATVGLEDRDGWTALMKAAENGHADIVALLLAQGASVNNQDSTGGWSALMKSSERGHLEVVRMLLDAGALIDQRDWGGFTALMKSAWMNHIAVMRLLLDHEADIDVQDTLFGVTALMVACVYGRAPLVELLLERGADPCKVSNAGATAMDILLREPQMPGEASLQDKADAERILRQHMVG